MRAISDAKSRKSKAFAQENPLQGGAVATPSLLLPSPPGLFAAADDGGDDTPGGDGAGAAAAGARKKSSLMARRSMSNLYGGERAPSGLSEPPPPSVTSRIHRFSVMGLLGPSPPQAARPGAADAAAGPRDSTVTIRSMSPFASNALTAQLAAIKASGRASGAASARASALSGKTPRASRPTGGAATAVARSQFGTVGFQGSAAATEMAPQLTLLHPAAAASRAAAPQRGSAQSTDSDTADRMPSPPARGRGTALLPNLAEELPLTELVAADGTEPGTARSLKTVDHGHDESPGGVFVNPLSAAAPRGRGGGGGSAAS
jgi:hypothetical protein